MVPSIRNLSAVANNTARMEEDFFGYSDSDISAENSKLSNLIQYLEDEITFLESEKGELYSQ